jgi:hypothetical protein
MTSAQTPAAGPAATATPKPSGKAVTLPETTEGNPWVSTHEIKKESNPFTDRDWRMLVYAWSGLAVRIVLVLGAIFSVYQFLAAREEKRVQYALDMVELWEKPEFQTAQRAVQKRIDSLNVRYEATLREQPTINARAFVLRRIGAEAMTPEGGDMPVEEFQEQFDRIVYFLNRISFCVEGDLCSREVIDAYFGEYAKSFWDYFAGYVGDRRKVISPTYAEPVETYVRGLATVPAKE